jgi:uncharacterized protein
VVLDPREGVASDGTIATGAARAAVPSAYTELLDDALATVTERLGDALHSLYLYGSVATGQARPPRSDLDLLAVVTRPTSGHDQAATELSHRHHDLVREVSIATVGIRTLARDDLGGRADRCFLTHYCVHLSGPDLRVSSPPCRPSVALAVGFNGDLGDALARARTQLEEATDPRDRARLTARMCRKILLAAATLLSAREGGWSTDRGTGVELIRRHQPALHPLAVTALRWSEPPPPGPPADVLPIVERLGGWLVEEYARSEAEHGGGHPAAGER